MHLSDSELQRWLDSSLGPAGRDRVRAHLDACESCRARRDEMAWLYQNLSVGEATAMAELEPPADLLDSVMARVATEPIPKPREWRVFAAVAGFAVAALTIGLYVMLGGGLEGWSEWAVQVGVQMGELAQAAGGLFTAVRVGLGALGPVIVLGAMTLVAGMATAARLAAAIRQRDELATAKQESSK